MKTTTLTGRIAAVGLTMILVPAAQALEMTQIAATFPHQLAVGPVDAPDNFSDVEVKVSGTATNQFQQFDATLGTLTAVDFLYNVTVDNAGSCVGGSSSLACSMFFFSGLTGSNGLSAVNPLAPNIVADQISVISRDLDQDLSFTGETSIPNIADFIGSGLIGDIAAEALIRKSSSTADLTNVSISFTGEYTLRYTFDPVVAPPPPPPNPGVVPLPGTFLLLLAGALGIRATGRLIS